MLFRSVKIIIIKAIFECLLCVRSYPEYVDLMVHELETGNGLSADSAEPAWESLSLCLSISLSLSLPLLLTLSLSLSK